MTAPTDATREFDPELFEFLRELKDHNDRDWFAANKDRYEAHVLEPALAFIEDFGYRLQSISPHFRADTRKTGGSLFRFYLHLAPGQVFGGGGIWHPDTKTATRIRQAIVDDPERWRAATREAPFTDVLDIGGHNEMLKRVPSGFDASFEFADDLRRRDYYGWAELSEKDATTPGFLDQYTRVCEAAAPLVKFLCDALDLEF
jgi:uncharacterized protein (DUF2461 family)